MGRPRKVVEVVEEEVEKDTFTCPICQKIFHRTDDTCYFIGKNPTCSWKCFLKFCDDHPAPPLKKK